MLAYSQLNASKHGKLENHIFVAIIAQNVLGNRISPLVMLHLFIVIFNLILLVATPSTHLSFRFFSRCRPLFHALHLF